MADREATQAPLPGLGEVTPVPRGELDKNSTLRAAINAFELHMKRQGFAENTIKSFLYDMNIFTRFIGANTTIGAISTQTLKDFTHWLVHERGVPCNPKSLARRITTLKVFFGWLAASEALPSDPAAPLIHKPVTTPLPIILTDDEIERMLAATQALRHGEKPDARPHLLVTLLLHTGIKKSECMNIMLSHLDFSDPSQPVLWVRYSNPRYRHKERKLRLPEWWPRVLNEYRLQYRPEKALFPCTARNLEYVLSDVAALAGLPNGLSFEMLRWTCAVRDARAGMDEETLRQKLGISKITWHETSAKLTKLLAPPL